MTDQQAIALMWTLSGLAIAGGVWLIVRSLVALRDGFDWEDDQK